MNIDYFKNLDYYNSLKVILLACNNLKDIVNYIMVCKRWQKYIYSILVKKNCRDIFDLKYIDIVIYRLPNIKKELHICYDLWLRKVFFENRLTRKIVFPKQYPEKINLLKKIKIKIKSECMVISSFKSYNNTYFGRPEYKKWIKNSYCILDVKLNNQYNLNYPNVNVEKNKYIIQNAMNHKITFELEFDNLYFKNDNKNNNKINKTAIDKAILLIVNNIVIRYEIILDGENFSFIKSSDPKSTNGNSFDLEYMKNEKYNIVFLILGLVRKNLKKTVHAFYYKNSTNIIKKYPICGEINFSNKQYDDFLLENYNIRYYSLYKVNFNNQTKNTEWIYQ
jgi:hypothetical protein